jgi:hypothetical protein
MACCAFAAFLLVQLLTPFRAIRAWFRGPSLPDNAAVAWRAGVPAAAKLTRTRRKRTRGLFAAAVVVELAIAVSWGVHVNSRDVAGRAPVHAAAAVAGEWDALVALHTYWCGTTETTRDAERRLALN